MGKKDIMQVLEKLNIMPRSIELYKLALTHSSYAHEHGLGCNAHNERLEFLGDAVLELVVSEELYLRFPNLPEGKLTRFRAGLVCEESLSALATSLDLGACLRLGKGEAASGGRKRPSLLADAFEALLGAIYLDLGIDAVKSVSSKLFASMLLDVTNGCLRHDYKTLMQEYTQAKLGITPEYQIVSELGPDHSKVFISHFLLNGDVLGQGEGRSKKEAEQEAAKMAYDSLVKN